MRAAAAAHLALGAPLRAANEAEQPLPEARGTHACTLALGSQRPSVRRRQGLAVAFAVGASLLDALDELEVLEHVALRVGQLGEDARLQLA